MSLDLEKHLIFVSVDLPSLEPEKAAHPSLRQGWGHDPVLGTVDPSDIQHTSRPVADQDCRQSVWRIPLQ